MLAPMHACITQRHHTSTSPPVGSSGPDDRKDALTVYKASLTPLIAHARATCSVMTVAPHTHLTQTRIYPCTDTHTPTHWTV